MKSFEAENLILRLSSNDIKNIYSIMCTIYGALLSSDLYQDSSSKT
jgi:hypothetical protein